MDTICETPSRNQYSFLLSAGHCSASPNASPAAGQWPPCYARSAWLAEEHSIYCKQEAHAGVCECEVCVCWVCAKQLHNNTQLESLCDDGCEG